MKKMLVMGVLTMTAALISNQQASAWINAKFSVGLNYNLQSGGNNWLWGAFRNGQPPGPEVGYPAGGPHGSGHGPNTFPYVYPQYGPYDFQWFGKNGNNAAPQGAPAAQQAPVQNNRVSSYGNASYYQPVSYSYGSSNPYYYYYHPQSNYGYQVPSYWYGR